MKSIEKEYTLFKNHKFPRTRYQGSKLKLIKWIESILKTIEFDSVLDAFSGTCSVSYSLKKMNKMVFCNDILNFNYVIAKALIENKNTQISQKDFESVIEKKNSLNYKFFIRDTFKDIYYLDEENEWLDIVVQNILKISDKYKRSMLFWALYQSCISKRPYNLFHRKNLYVRTSNVKRNFGNKTTWDKSFKSHMIKFLKEINEAIFDNGHKNKVFNKDVFDLDVKPDLIYIDTPYIPSKGTLTNYRNFYHFLEGITDYHNWEEKIDFNSKHKKLYDKYNIWNDKRNIYNGFVKLIDKFNQSKILISYRGDGIPTIDELINILKREGKKVRVEKIDYKYVLSRKNNLKEYLLIGE